MRVLRLATFLAAPLSVFLAASCSSSDSGDGKSPSGGPDGAATTDAAAPGDAAMPVDGATPGDGATTDGGGPEADGGASALAAVTGWDTIAAGAQGMPVVDLEGDVYVGGFAMTRYPKGEMPGAPMQVGVINANVNVQQMAVDSDGNVWAATGAYLPVISLPAGSETWQDAHANLTTGGANTYHAVGADIHGNVYLGHQDYGPTPAVNHIYKRAHGGTTFTEVCSGLPTGAGGTIGFVNATGDGTVWATTSSLGLYKCAPGDAAFSKVMNGTFRGLSSDASGRLVTFEQVTPRIIAITGGTTADLTTTGFITASQVGTEPVIDGAGTLIVAAPATGALTLYTLAAGAASWTKIAPAGAPQVDGPRWLLIDGKGRAWVDTVNLNPGLYRSK